MIYSDDDEFCFFLTNQAKIPILYNVLLATYDLVYHRERFGGGREVEDLFGQAGLLGC